MRLSCDLRAGLDVCPEPRDLVRGISQKYLQHLKGVRVAELGDEQKKDCVIEREWPVHAIILSCRAPECARSNAARTGPRSGASSKNRSCRLRDRQVHPVW